MGSNMGRLGSKSSSIRAWLSPNGRYFYSNQLGWDQSIISHGGSWRKWVLMDYFSSTFNLSSALCVQKKSKQINKTVQNPSERMEVHLLSENISESVLSPACLRQD